MTHFRDDRHQDHSVISDLAYQIWRRAEIWEYPIPKSDIEGFVGNIFLCLDKEAIDLKTSHLCSSFLSQHEKYWYSSENFKAFARVNGLKTCGLAEFAETFLGRRFCVK